MNRPTQATILTEGQTEGQTSAQVAGQPLAQVAGQPSARTAGTPAISIIIPVYNAAESLPACIDGLLQQDFTDFELILVDDASTDNTAALCHAAAAAHARVRCHSLARNAGQGVARNAGLALAQGQYILFVDADDTIQPHALDAIYTCVQNEDADVVVYGYTVVASDAVRTYIPANHYSAKELLQAKDFFPAPWNKIFRRSFIEQHKLHFPASRSAEDVAFIFKTLVCQPRVAACCQTLYTYNFHVGNISHQLARRSDAFISLLDIQAFLRQHRMEADYAPQFRKVIVDFALRHPMHLFLIASLVRGKNRAQNLRAFPLFMLRLLRFFYTLYTR